MGFWSRIIGRKPKETRQEAEEAILVISDIHLGEDVLQEGPEHLSAYIRVLNRELAEFVQAHRESGRSGRRWHLVINGDMFDFVKVSVAPETPEEETYQAWSRRLNANETISESKQTVLFKLRRMLEIHRPLFKELARFVLEGHRITMIEGNHDAEFFFDEVKSTVRDFIIDLAERVHRENDGTELDRQLLMERIAFRSWFIASSGRYHIEHGHQYDQYCSFEYNLQPVEREDIIAVPMSHRVMPYFSDLLGDFSTHGVDKWTLGQWFRFLFSLGPRMIWVLATTYAAAMKEVLQGSGAKRREALKAAAEAHRQRLESLARETEYGYQTLSNLERLRATPAEYSVWKMMHVFYIDRLLVGAVSVLLLLVSLLIGGSTGLIMAGVVLTLGVGASVVMARSRVSSVEELLRVAAAQIADETGARYVVFGHSHHPELVDLKARYGVGRFGESAYYLNSGSWVTREIMLGDASKGMTFVELSEKGAALKRWQGLHREALVLASTHAPDQEPLLPAAAAEPAV